MRARTSRPDRVPSKWGIVSLHTRTMRIWGAVVIVAAVMVLVAFALPSALLGALAMALAALAFWQLSRAEAAQRRTAAAEEPRAVRDPIQKPAEASIPASSAADGPSAAAGAPHQPAPPPTPRIPATLEPAVVLGALVDAARLVAEPVSAHLWLLDDSSATLRLISSVGPLPPSSQPVPLDGDDIMAAAVESSVAQFRAQAQMRGRDGAFTLWRFALPLDAGETRGVAAVDFQLTAEPDCGTLPAATAPLRGALTGCLALHVANAERDTARLLIEIARDLSRMLDPEKVLTTALDRAMELANAATGSIMLVDPLTGRLTMAVARGLPASAVKGASLAEGEGIAGWVLASGQPLLIEDLPARTPAARRHGVRSAVSVPIGDGEGVLGVLNVGARSFPARFTEAHLGAIEMLGRQTATALRNARAIKESREIYFDTLKALAIALETKDPYSAGGTERVLEYSDALGYMFDLDAEEREALRIAALLHDIGMAAAGESVISADRPLSTVERALLKMHPQIAAEILGQAPALRHVVPIVYHHHEWYDGSGYGGGLAGQRIPLGARILAVADAYVAMTSDRPYRSAMTEREAMRELSERAGTQFDPAVVDALRDLLGKESDRIPGTNR